MEVFKEILAKIALLVIGVPLVLIFAGWAINVIQICWVIGDEIKECIACKIRKRIRDEYKSPKNYW